MHNWITQPPSQPFVLDDFNVFVQYSEHPTPLQKARQFQDNFHLYPPEAQYINGQALQKKRNKNNLMFTSPLVTFGEPRKSNMNLMMPSPQVGSSLFGQQGNWKESNFDEVNLVQIYSNEHALQQQKNLIVKQGNLMNKNKQIKNSIYQRIDFSQFEQYPQTPIKKSKDGNEFQQNQLSTVKKNVSGFNQKQKITIPMIAESVITNSTKNKQSKGLRNLSQSVRDIVLRSKKSTYKQVADKLVQKLQTQKKISNNARDEQNIKRRVYDALNVLISAGVLKKQDKLVYSDNENKANRNNHRQQQQRWKYHENLLSQIQLAQFNIKQKYQKLSSLRNKYLANQYLIQRNKQFKKQKKLNKIDFPFIGVLTKKSDIKLLHSSKKQVKLSFQNPGFKIIGDIDAILKLGFHLNQILSRLPNDLHKFQPNFVKKNSAQNNDQKVKKIKL